MPDYIRVRDKETGHHLSILRSQFDRNPSAWQELQQPATYRDGSPLPPKHKTTVSTEAEKKASQAAANDTKEK